MLPAHAHAAMNDDALREVEANALREVEANALREVEANIAVLITEELVAQHELGAHPHPVADCSTCRAHAHSSHRPLPFGA
jgi:hypothetical protein